ncbi:hypothetical protein PHJA_001663100 [Phtheirospermum japonicum]|uniref:Uncharacterized protein n=1 Tax=Phtheirospermum japonicum TaxID=374723 RepID=A0A830C396_9LAMI|nr:hypothetical protein PHJA_001663100 [Phtheirospermum japonicum]
MYFSWIDPPICARARQIIPGILKRVNRLEGDLGRRNFREKFCGCCSLFLGL